MSGSFITQCTTVNCSINDKNIPLKMLSSSTKSFHLCSLEILSIFKIKRILLTSALKPNPPFSHSPRNHSTTPPKCQTTSCDPISPVLTPSLHLYHQFPPSTSTAISIPTMTPTSISTTKFPAPPEAEDGTATPAINPTPASPQNVYTATTKNVAIAAKLKRKLKEQKKTPGRVEGGDQIFRIGKGKWCSGVCMTGNLIL